MKNLNILLILILPLIFTSCVVVDNTPGPPGRDGFCYFGTDYDVARPYSYWDDNPALPSNALYGEYYMTHPGIYNFEYFINRRDYWYGTYEIFLNLGGIGGPNGQPGFDALDSYLMLVCDPAGFYEERTNARINMHEPLVIEKNDGKFHYRITIQKGNIDSRKAQTPKILNH